MKFHFILYFLFFSCAAHSAGFDCNKAATDVEKMICGSPELDEQDSQLNSLYEKAKKVKHKDEVLADLKDWLKNTRNKCETVSCLEEAYATFLPKIESKISLTPSNKNDQPNVSKLLTPWWLVALGPLGFWFWNTFLRKKCPTCKSANFSYVSAKEVDRWRQSVKVSEQVGNGNTRERHVQKTYIKVKRDYECNDCQYKWSELDTEEK